MGHSISSILDIGEIEKLYVNGESSRQIAAQFNVSQGAILDRLKDAKVKMRPAEYPRKKTPDEEICKLYCQGWSCYEIGDKFNLHRCVIEHRLKKTGIKLRSPGCGVRGGRYDAQTAA